MPQQKKHSSTRRRRNTASTATTLRVVGEGEEREIPKLPTQRFDRVTGKKIRWLQVTREWWSDLWVSPMSSEYTNADKHQLFLLADLYDRYWRSPSAALAAEIRQQRAAFGMTPYDRRRLEWTIEAAEGAKDQGRRRRERSESAGQPPKPADDPRNTLSMS